MQKWAVLIVLLLFVAQTAIPSPAEPSAWPQPLFAPYVDAVIWPTYDFINAIDETGVTHFHLGFVVAASLSNCEPSWGTWYAADGVYLQDQISAVRARGGDVIASFGGAANTELALACGSPGALQQAYQQVIDAYGLTRIDFDIEGAALADLPSIERRSQAIAGLQQAAADAGRELAVWFTLPVLPTGLLADALNLLQSALDHGIEIAGVNIMTMNYGSDPAPDPDGQMGAYAIQAAASLFGQLRSLYNDAGIPKSDEEIRRMIGMTPMIGLNDVTTERFYPQDAQEVLAYAQAQGLGLLAFWSLNRDRQCEEGEVPYLSPTCSSILQDPFEFALIFAPFTGGAAATPGIAGLHIPSVTCRIRPNPFSRATKIVLEVVRAGRLKCELYDARGRRLGNLADRTFEPGRHTLTWDAGAYNPGVYFLSVESPAWRGVERLVLVK